MEEDWAEDLEAMAEVVWADSVDLVVEVSEDLVATGTSGDLVVEVSVEASAVTAED